MRFWIVGLILLSLLLLTVPAAALVPEITVSSDAEWLVAGSGESATITVEVQDDGSPLPGLGVAFSVDAEYGSITGASGVTDSDGRAKATFTPGTRSGDALITVAVTYHDGEMTGVAEDVYLQQIDHAAPYSLAGLEYAEEATVGEETDITVRLADRYGNPIDNRNTAESVVFSVGSTDGTAGFVNGEECETPVTVEVDGAGDAIATLRVGQRAGDNLVVIDSPGPIADKYISIFGVANGMPAGISFIMSPSTGFPPYVPADEESKFSFTYTLFDRYGNPTQGQQLWVNTTMGGENRLLTTSSSGQVSITYGPKDTTGKVTITATAVANASVTVSQEVEFTSTDPVNMLLTASPQTMPSRDVKPDSVALVRAKVMDIKGNPVSNETVAFTLLSFDNGTYIQTGAPHLGGQGVGVPVTATTDGNGHAVVLFTPGAFATDREVAGYDPTATGTCTVEATWGNVTRTIVLTWKNYPYLSVETSVDPETVPVNGTIDTTIRLRGDGWALQPDPIDVVLCTDRSGSMLKDYPDRMVKAMEASEIFNTQMNYARDRMGLVTFGKQGRTDILDYSYYYWLGRDDRTSDDWTYKNQHYPADGRYYAEYAVLDLPLSSNPSAINSSIEQIVPESGTPMRYGIYKAINELKDNGRSSAIKAVIVLSDGDYNYYGDPLARGTGYTSVSPTQFGDRTDNYYAFPGLGTGSSSNQNMSVYAMSNSVRIYSIAFAQDISSGGKATLRTLAESTGGKYYEAPTGDELARVYTDIAGELKVEAGVNTTMDVSFDDVEVNGTAEDGADVFDYVYADDISTRIYSANDTVVFINNKTRDDTQNWTGESPVLHFDVGTVRLNQTWETTFRLKVLADGNINVFGSGSSITFNDADTLDLPDLFVTAIPDLTNTGVETGTLDIANLHCTGSGPYLDFLPLAWDLAYTGVHEVTEDIYFQADGVSWIYVDSQIAGSTETGDDCQIDVRDLPPGDYTIKVKATAPDAPVDEEILDTAVWIGQKERSYIQIR